VQLPGQADEGGDDGGHAAGVMQVERARLDDGRALLLFTWQAPPIDIPDDADEDP
jgi:hypothetical protein